MRAEEVTGQPFLSLEIGVPVKELAASIARVLDGSEDSIEHRLQGLDRRGRSVACRVRLSPLLDDDRRVRGVILIMEDITEDLASQSQARQLGRVLAESSNEIYLLDPENFRFRLLNKAAERKLGYGIDELRSMSLGEFLPGVSLRALQLLVEPLMESGGGGDVAFEGLIRSRDGGERPAEICLQLIAEEHPQVLLMIVRELAERSQAAPLSG